MKMNSDQDSSVPLDGFVSKLFDGLKSKLEDEFRKSIFADPNLRKKFEDELRNSIQKETVMEKSNDEPSFISLISTPAPSPAYYDRKGYSESELDDFLAREKVKSITNNYPNLDKPLSAKTSVHKKRSRYYEVDDPVSSKQYRSNNIIADFCGKRDCGCRYIPTSKSDSAINNRQLISQVKIYITGLPGNIDRSQIWRELGILCGKCRAFPIKTFVGDIRGKFCAIIQFKHHNSAVRAINELKNMSFHGCRLKANFFRNDNDL